MFGIIQLWCASLSDFQLSILILRWRIFPGWWIMDSFISCILIWMKHHGNCQTCYSRTVHFLLDQQICCSLVTLYYLLKSDVQAMLHMRWISDWCMDNSDSNPTWMSNVYGEKIWFWILLVGIKCIKPCVIMYALTSSKDVTSASWPSSSYFNSLPSIVHIVDRSN